MLDIFRTGEPDPMMAELREVREAISEELAGLSTSEMVQYFRSNLEQMAEELGCDLVPQPGAPGRFRLAPRANRSDG